jgi:hypothetical protein
MITDKLLDDFEPTRAGGRDSLPIMRVLLLYATLAGCSGTSPLAEVAPGDRSAEAGARDVAVDLPGVDGPRDASPEGARELGAPCGGACAPPAVCVGGQCYSYPKKRVGIFYLAWHAFAADAMQQVGAAQQRTVEDVIRSASPSFFTILPSDELRAQAMSFHYHARPKLGFYCLYRKRPGEPPYAEPNFVPDCTGISAVAKTHAQQLWSAGVDFVYHDLTNIPEMGPFADVLGVRPLEVLLEEWAALRAAGTMTPQVAAWLPAPTKAAGKAMTYEAVLAIYNRPAFSDLILRNAGGRKVIFLVDHATSEASRALIEANSGANDVVAVRLWGLLDKTKLAAGVASWMQPCEASGTWTTIVEAGKPCGQGATPKSPIGSMLSASISYQLGYASLPFQAAGRADGLTFKQQIATAFALQPDWLLINSWNELIAQPQPNPYPASMGELRKSMGVLDSSGLWLWVDPYGAEYLRDIEPTAEWGSRYYDLLASCLRVYRLQGCAAPGAKAEECCQVSETYRLIRSLRVKDPGNSMTTHHVLSHGTVERDALVASGQWEEVCNPIQANPQLCGGGAMANADGPFRLHVSGGANRVLLTRCYTGVANFFSTDPSCEGTQVVGPLGYVSALRTSETARPLRRCFHATAQRHFHWLGPACPTLAGVNDEAQIGFVR